MILKFLIKQFFTSAKSIPFFSPPSRSAPCFAEAMQGESADEKVGYNPPDKAKRWAGCSGTVSF